MNNLQSGFVGIVKRLDTLGNIVWGYRGRGGEKTKHKWNWKCWKRKEDEENDLEAGLLNVVVRFGRKSGVEKVNLIKTF